VEADFSAKLNTLLGWADEVARLKVMANADTAQDASRALRYGAMGIGLCRTARMFNDVLRLPVVIEMIVAETQGQRQAALDKLLPMQRSDFKALFEVMSPQPVIIRLLDPPIHEFLPSERQLQEELESLRRLKGTVRGMEVPAGTLSLLHGPGQATEEEAASIRHLVEAYRVEEAENKFLPMYNEKGILQDNPFEVLDEEGVGQADGTGRAMGAQAARESHGRHLRRAWRAPRFNPLLSPGGSGLRVLLGTPGAGGPPGRGPRHAPGKPVVRGRYTACPTPHGWGSQFTREPQTDIAVAEVRPVPGAFRRAQLMGL